MGLIFAIVVLVVFAVGFDQALLRVDCALGIESRCDEIRAIRTPSTGEET